MSPHRKLTRSTPQPSRQQSFRDAVLAPPLLSSTRQQRQQQHRLEDPELFASLLLNREEVYSSAVAASPRAHSVHPIALAHPIHPIVQEHSIVQDRSVVQGCSVAQTHSLHPIALAHPIYPIAQAYPITQAHPTSQTHPIYQAHSMGQAHSITQPPLNQRDRQESSPSPRSREGTTLSTQPHYLDSRPYPRSYSLMAPIIRSRRLCTAGEYKRKQSKATNEKSSKRQRAQTNSSQGRGWKYIAGGDDEDDTTNSSEVEVIQISDNETSDVEGEADDDFKPLNRQLQCSPQPETAVAKNEHAQKLQQLQEELEAIKAELATAKLEAVTAKSETGVVRAILQKKEEEMKNREEEMENRDKEMENRDKEMENRDKEMERKMREIEKRDKEMERKEEEIEKRGDELLKIEDELKKKDKEMEKKGDEIEMMKTENSYHVKANASLQIAFKAKQADLDFISRERDHLITLANEQQNLKGKLSLVVAELKHCETKSKTFQALCAVYRDRERLHNAATTATPSAINPTLFSPTPSLQDHKASTPTALRLSPAPSSSPFLSAASLEDQKIENIRRTYTKIKRKFDTLHSAAINVATSTQTMDLSIFGEFGQYVRQLRIVLDQDRAELAQGQQNRN